MKHFVRIVALWFCLAPGFAPAQSADEQYVRIYSLIQEGDTLKAAGQWRPAWLRYNEAQEAIKKFQASFPNWNPNVIVYRSGYLSSRMAELAPKVPAEPGAPGTTNAASGASTNLAGAVETPEQIAALKENLRRLEAENTDLAAKLKEAFSAQPTPVDTKELAKATEALKVFQKENDLLKVSLDQAHQKAAALADPAALAAAQKSLTEAKKQVEAQTKELALAHEEIDVLKKRLTPSMGPAPSAPSSAGAALEIKLKQLQTENATLLTERKDLETLRARLAVYEAKPIPFTAAELAVLKATPPPATLPETKGPAAEPKTTAATEPKTTPAAEPKTTTPIAPPAKRNYKELPPGVGEMFAQARRDFVARRYGDAEKKFQEMLRQDEKNVYLLGFLAASQIELGHLPEAEKTLQAALATEPDDAQNLFQFGRLRYNQNKMDEALDALSRAVKGSPENPEVQNLLGAVLAEKGQRQAAETAFRKALVVDPTFPSAHKNLAFFYATQKPPTLALARWHYNKALEFGLPPEPGLEKLLNPKPDQAEKTEKTEKK